MGDKVVITDTQGSTQDSSVVELISEYSFSIKGQGRIVSASTTIERKILRSKVDVNLNDYQYIDDYLANVPVSYTHLTLPTIYSV